MKRFIREILPSYEGVEVKYIAGAVPEVVFRNDQDEEVKVRIFEYAGLQLLEKQNKTGQMDTLRQTE